MKFKNSLEIFNFNINFLHFAFFALFGFFIGLVSTKDVKFEHNLAAFINPAQQVSLAFNIANKENDTSVHDVNSLAGKYFTEVPTYNGMPFTLNKETKELTVKVNSLSCSTINSDINKYGKNVNYGCTEVNKYIGDEKFTEYVAFYKV